MSAFMEWIGWHGAPGDYPIVMAALGAALLTLVVARGVVRRTRLGSRLDAAITLIGCGTILVAAQVLAPEGVAGFARWARALAAAAFAIAGVRIALVLIVDLYLRQRKGYAPSAIFRDVAGLLVYFVIVLVILHAMLDINLASLVATSAVLTAVIGLALQDVLGSVISGLVLEAEASFTAGDWVKVGAFEGEVRETGWRTTRLRTRFNEVIVLPNTYLAREPLVNYSRPDPRHRDGVRFEAGYEIPPNTVKQVAGAVLAADPAVAADPPPEVHTGQYNPSGIEYAARFWTADFANLIHTRDRILTNLWYALQRGGVRLPFPTTDLVIHSSLPAPPFAGGDVITALRRVPLLTPLHEEELQALAATARRLPFGQGEAIVREGDPGDSFYLIEGGEVSVSIGAAAGPRVIDHMRSGDCFGEMSLLAGEPRSATVTADGDVVVLEIDRRAFEKILVANPRLLEPISQIAAHRQETQRTERAAAAVLPSFAQDPAAQHVLRRIRSFFGL